MSAKVVSLAEHAPRPHLSGEVKCMACGHEWIAAVPVGTAGIECPSCHCPQGVMRDFLSHATDDTWRCHCGSELFRVLRGGVMCVGCGTMQRF